MSTDAKITNADTWVTAAGWTTAHLRRAQGWTVCGREIHSPVEALPHDRRCGQCARRRATI